MQSQAWRCTRCGSTEQRRPRPNRDRPSPQRGCAECHRREARRQTARIARTGLTQHQHRIFRLLLRDDFEDVVLTVEARVYLDAFTRWVVARRDGDGGEAYRARRAKRAALERLEEEAGA
jgi:hypothetical protein